MSRLCRCSRSCRHIVPGAYELLPPERLLPLLDVMGVLVDAADSFDMDGLQYNPECGVHGERSISNAECLCRGERVSASEFIAALQRDARTAAKQQRAVRFEPGHRPRRKHDEQLNLAVAG